MHAVVRNYSGAGAKELFDLLEARKGEVESLIRGTDESLQVARNWIQENAADLDTAAPSVSEGSVIVQLS
jgi:hypothetical protein